MADETDTHHHHHHCNQDELRTDANYRAIAAEVERYGMANGDRINTAGAAAALAACHTGELVQGTSCATDRLVQDTSCTTDRLVQGTSARSNEIAQAGFAGVHDRLCDAKAGIIHEIDRHGDASALAACKINDAIGDSKLFNAVQFKDQVIAGNLNASTLGTLVSTVGNAAQVLATTIGNAASVQATTNYNGLSVQATNNYNGTTVQIERVRAELEAKTAAGFAASTLLAFQNKADSDAKAAACCCELKALITAEGVATRGLANEIEARRVQNELQRLQTQVLVLTGGAIGGAATARG